MATKSDTVKVRTTGWSGNRGPGAELELTEREARTMVRKGQARYADDPDAPAKRDWPKADGATAPATASTEPTEKPSSSSGKGSKGATGG